MARQMALRGEDSSSIAGATHRKVRDQRPRRLCGGGRLDKLARGKVLWVLCNVLMPGMGRHRTSKQREEHRGEQPFQGEIESSAAHLRHQSAECLGMACSAISAAAQAPSLIQINTIDTRHKNWKMQPSDIEEMKYWKQYRKAYEDFLAATSTRNAPWYVVPADDKQSARLLVSHITLDRLQELNMSFPETTAKRRRVLQAMRRQLQRKKR